MESADTRAKLTLAIDFFIDQDYFFATENMILWLRHLQTDVAGCPANKITNALGLLHNAMETLRA